MSNLSVSYAAAERVLRLEGDVGAGADAQLLSAIKDVGAGDLKIDCAAIRSINSVGAAAWTTFLDGVPDSVSYRFVSCPPVLLDYCNLVRNFCRRGSIESVVLVYECLDCGHVRPDVKALAAVQKLDAFSAETCPKCRKAGFEPLIELDALRHLKVA